MRRELSAGAVVVNEVEGDTVFAAIRPAGKPQGLWALPKGHISEGEAAAVAAMREAREETGVEAELVSKLGDVRYVYTWEGERILKLVSFFLARYRSGTLGQLSAEHAHEIDEVRWLPLADASRLLAYAGERKMAQKALAALAS